MSGAKISHNNKELIIKGSIDEDDQVRALNHFMISTYMGFNNGRTAKYWAEDTLDNSYSWGSAIKATLKYCQRLYIPRSYTSCEDMTVPDHTRNDAHKGDGATGLSGESHTKLDRSYKDRDTLRGLYMKF